MEHFRSYSLIFAFIVLSSAFCRAGDSICTQTFNDMYGNGTLVTADPYKVGITNFVTYTCRGTNAKFWSTGGGTIALLLPDKNDSVVTSRITNLKQVTIYYTDKTGSPDYLLGVVPTMLIKVSEDSVVWTNLTSGATHSGGVAAVSLLDPGDYYISVRNIGSSKPIYIHAFEYKTQHCNCYQYHP